MADLIPWRLLPGNQSINPNTSVIIPCSRTSRKHVANDGHNLVSNQVGDVLDLRSNLAYKAPYIRSQGDRGSCLHCCVALACPSFAPTQTLESEHSSTPTSTTRIVPSTGLHHDEDRSGCTQPACACFPCSWLTFDSPSRRVGQSSAHMDWHVARQLWWHCCS